jgi:hypothetical protein
MTCSPRPSGRSSGATDGVSLCAGKVMDVLDDPVWHDIPISVASSDGGQPGPRAMFEASVVAAIQAPCTCLEEPSEGCALRWPDEPASIELFARISVKASPNLLGRRCRAATPSMQMPSVTPKSARSRTSNEETATYSDVRRRSGLAAIIAMLSGTGLCCRGILNDSLNRQPLRHRRR